MTKKQENQPVVGIPADTNNLHLTEEQEHAIKLWGSTAYEEGRCCRCRRNPGNPAGLAKTNPLPPGSAE